MTVSEIADPAERSRICREILDVLPGWFGLPESNARYEREVAELPTFAIGDDAFLSLKLQSRAAAELYVMGVRPELHGLYEARGFVPLEELHGIWDEDNPCLLLVTHVSCR
jgi:hypothetical protein